MLLVNSNLKSFLTYLILSLTLCVNAQSNWENFSISAGVGANALIYDASYITYHPSTQSNPCNRCFTTTRYRAFDILPRIPLRLSYDLNRFVFDITYAISEFREIHSNIGFDLLKQTRLSTQPQLQLGLNFSNLNSYRSIRGAARFLGLNLTFGPEKWKFRYSLSKGLSDFGDTFSTLDFMYYIYPFRKREKVKE